MMQPVFFSSRGFLQVFGLVEELIFELLKGLEGGGVLGEFASEGVEGFFRGGAGSNASPFGLNDKRAFSTILFTGAQKERGVFDEISGFDFTAGDFAKSGLAQGGENCLGNLIGAVSDKSENGIGFLGGKVKATGPTIPGIDSKKFVDLLARDGS